MRFTIIILLILEAAMHETTHTLTTFLKGDCVQGIDLLSSINEELGFHFEHVKIGENLSSRNLT
ncbi:MAG: hypothetical protein AAGC43_05000 [Bacteroidota bacterium]